MNIEALAKRLDNYSLVVSLNNKVYNYTENGVIPLMMQLASDGLNGAIVADRVIGKAAAFLMVYGGVKEVYTRVISLHASEVFCRYGIKYSADETVDYIVNRAGNDMCPMEKACLSVETPETAYKILSEKIKQ